MQSRVLGLVAVCLGLCAPTASADYLIVPPDLENTQGGLGGVTPFSFPTTTGIHTQLSYDASLFGPNPLTITAVQFRPIDPTGGFFGDTLNVSNVQIRLSTTPRSDENRNPLSARFADNVGPDATTVYSGQLRLTTASTLLPNGTRAFDYEIAFQTPFDYDPSAGNLLLDVVVPPGETVRGNAFFGSFPRFDTTGFANDGIYSVSNTSDGAAPTGTVATSGPVTRFVTEPSSPAPVPAPASLVLAASGAAILFWRSRRALATAR
jgi:hypothetical protein